MSILKYRNSASDPWQEIQTITGVSGAHVGPDAPTDPEIGIWVDTDEQGESVVTSVNGKSGPVTLDAEDVGAVPTEWTLLGTSSSSSQTVTYPADAKEILIKASARTSGVAYYNTIPVMAIQDVTIIMVSGYYYGSGDTGIANLNHNATNRTLGYRNLYYNGSGGGYFTFWYR